MQDTDVLIIGAGAAGLAAAHALMARGLSVQLVEKEPHVGEPWRQRHRNLTLNSYRDLSTLPGVAYPPGTPAFPAREAVVSLFEDFVRLHGLPIAFGTEVRQVRRDNDRWIVETNDGTRSARNVVVATGRDRVPHMPDWPGHGGFTGRLLHAAAFGEAAAYAGKSVLVSGAGNSGFDVLNHLVRARTGPIWLSARSGPAILPKRIANLAVHKVSPFLASLPTWLADAVIAMTQRLSLGSHARLGLPPPIGGGASRLRGDSIAIATDDGAVRAIKAGRVRVIGPIRSFDRDSVVLEDGSIVKPDVVIAATGYRTGLEPLVGHLGVLDPRGKPLFNGAAQDPRLPGLWFTGMRPDLRGCFTNARLQAEAIAAAISASRRDAKARRVQLDSGAAH
ncbi:MAG: NAD(P)/FAD-dependent oxidoreductase [Rhizobiaceae bacterium]|nr:NAD(P)/FAD-dependent oxidoreductase [Rhizobiaceae bacterium]